MMGQRQASGLLQLQPQWIFTRGPAYGVCQPALLTAVRIRLPQEVDWFALQQAMAPLLPDYPGLDTRTLQAEPAAVAAVRLLLTWAWAIQHAAGLAVFTEPRILDRQRHGNGDLVVRIALPAPHARAGLLALQWALENLAGLLADGAGQPVVLAGRAQACREQLARHAPGGSNTRRFLQAAHERGIPWRLLAGNVYEVGQGVHARWLDSTFTDATSQVGAGLARNKLLAAQVLRAAGLPVPAHRPVVSAEQAREEAARLGYPVVIKPMDRDGGAGVAAGLQTPEQVMQAFARARVLSDNVLLEKHVEGRDYRLTVLDGRLLWAIERVPGGVTGDGRHSVAGLLEALNADPRRGLHDGAALKPLALDDEALELLRLAGLSPDAVPASGRFVRLRRTANVSTGGMPVAVLDQVHPDNRRLAERAALALRLDLAGIDLLIPDIARSWRETGAAICEVNAQPQLGATTAPHLYGEILQHLLGGDGRLPLSLVVVESLAGGAAILAALRAHWRDAGVRCGYRDEQGVWLDGECLAGADADFFAAGQMLLAHPDCAAAVLLATPAELLQCGLPFDRCDQLVLAAEPAGLSTALAGEMLRLLLPHVGAILHGAWHELAEHPAAQQIGSDSCMAEALPMAAARFWCTDPAEQK